MVDVYLLCFMFFYTSEDLYKLINKGLNKGYFEYLKYVKKCEIIILIFKLFTFINDGIIIRSNFENTKFI